MARIHQTSIWQLQIPDSWNVQGTGEAATLFRPDGIGMLMVLTEERIPSDLSRDAIERHARECWPTGSTFAETSCGKLRGITTKRTDDRGTHWQGWWLPCRGRLVYASYQCAAAHADSERGEIDDILQTIAESQEA